MYMYVCMYIYIYIYLYMQKCVCMNVCIPIMTEAKNIYFQTKLFTLYFPYIYIYIYIYNHEDVPEQLYVYI